MDRHGGHACLLQSLGELHAVAAAHVPAPAEFGRDGSVRQGFHHGLHDAARLLRVFHQRRAVAVVHDFSHGTAHIDVQDVCPGDLYGDLSGLRHADRIAAEDLHGGRVLPGKLGQQGEGFFVVVAEGLGGDELRDRVASSQFGADLTEGHVRDAGHGSQGQPGGDLNITDAHGGAPFI